MSSTSRLWPTQTAVIFTADPGTTGMLVRDLLRTRGWKAVESTASIDAVLGHLTSGRATLVIVDDTPDLPGAFVLRRLLCDVVGSITPTLVMLSQAFPADAAAIASMGGPAIVQKPIITSKFYEAFDGLIKRWQDDFHTLLRKVTFEFTRGNEATAIKALSKMNDNNKARAIVAPALAMFSRKNKQITVAEKILLAAIQDSPKNLGLILTLADLYMHVAMPHLAQRLLYSARGTYGNSLTIMADLVQCSLMLNNLNDAIVFLAEMQSKNYLPDLLTNFLTRTLYSEGRQTDVAKYTPNPLHVTRLEAAWEAANAAPTKASA